MIVGWTKDLPDSKYFEEIAGKIFWWMRCELRKKEAKMSQNLWSEQLDD